MSSIKSRGIERMQLSTAYHDEPEILALKGEFGPIAEFISIKITGLILSKGHYYPYNVYTLYYIAQQTGASVELVESVIVRMAEYGLLDRELLVKENIMTGYELQKFFYSVTVRRADSPERNKYRLYRNEAPTDEADKACDESEAEKATRTASEKAPKSAKKPAKKGAKTLEKQSEESTCEADSASESAVATDDCRAIDGTNSDFACKNRRSNSNSNSKGKESKGKESRSVCKTNNFHHPTADAVVEGGGGFVSKKMNKDDTLDSISEEKRAGLRAKFGEQRKYTFDELEQMHLADEENKIRGRPQLS